jgi:hypothetical protein
MGIKEVKKNLQPKLKGRGTGGWKDGGALRRVDA